MGRMSYAATINAHLAYPIYCLRFDRTGRYFITGGDDYLSRVFCLGSHVRAKSGSSLDPQSYKRGAVLVCTLRGHAGVVNDIAVSSDNAFLATASEDGDCRVWGLRDGSPIAILRGHTGGANMVSWSTLTPYRLVTAGADGYARCWDIREACLIRYGGVIGKRFEYKRRKEEAKPSEKPEELLERAEREGVSLPPIPARAEPATAVETNGANANVGAQETLPQVPVPILPLPPPPGGQRIEAIHAPADVDAAEEDEPGRFVSGSNIDEGVSLLSKMQHGVAVEERGGLGTRSRRAAVKVLCVDVCPLGRHIATGADDGICRVFSACDDPGLERLDVEKADCGSREIAGAPLVRQSKRHLVSGKTLLTLKGHLTAITDLKYSYGGDRLLSASQRDGVARIWSWSGDPMVSSDTAANVSSPGSGNKNCHVSHITIKLTNPEKLPSRENGGSRSNRQRPARTSAASTISCDVAAWMKDDSKIVTSQSELVKQSSSEIQPGSQYIFVWDSFSGHCLLGIRSAHSKQCPVVLPHPMLSNILCSGGADGLIKLWDIDKGECVLEHKNTVDFGPVEARDIGMISGYLDGSFSPDGTEVVLTDDCGRLTVLDCSKASDREGFPSWMREQYFANDYYELLYDQHGYCVERGSERPPHLAPRGVRCSHSGAPWSEQVNGAFKSLTGPLPDPVDRSLWSRLNYRLLSRSHQKRPLKRNVVGQYDPESTTMIGEETTKAKQVPVATQEAESASAPSSPRLSSNWRWRDYSDILREEGQGEEEDPDADDDSFELNDVSNRNALGDEDDDSDVEPTNNAGTNRRTNRREAEAEPSRHSNRNPRNRRQNRYAELLDSSDDELVEYMSSNNTPSGPFRSDYETHFFRITNGSHLISRDWACRYESTSAYMGRKSYSPQVGDEVVYIPRAHFDVLSEFPTITSPPWQNWPHEAEWPVVRCCIRSIRYRLPYRAFFRKNHSIVAILTLEVNGIPELSSDRPVPWPKPVFVDSPSRHLFEVPMFETDTSDFVIPIGLYNARLAAIEKVIIENDGLGLGTKVEAFYGAGDDRDADLVPYEGILNGWEEEDFDSNDPNLIGSGYRSLIVTWGGTEADRVSPWEMVVAETGSAPEVERPQLDNLEKKKVREALAQIRSIENVEEYFVYPVNIQRYTDYMARVEVPMCLDIIRTRIDADYYASRLSVVYDVKLIWENSKKYNGDDPLTELALTMYQKFCSLVLSEEELVAFREFEKTLETNAEQNTGHRDEGIEGETMADSGSAGLIRRSRRQSVSRSSLENLPAPQPGTRRSGRRRTPSVRNASMLETAPLPPSQNRSMRTRSRDELGRGNGANAAPAAPLVPLNSSNRGRTTRNSRGQQPSGRQLRSSDSLAASRVEEESSRVRRGRLRIRVPNNSGSRQFDRQAPNASSLEAVEDNAGADDSEREESRPRGRSVRARGTTVQSGGNPEPRQPVRNTRIRNAPTYEESPSDEGSADSENDERPPRRASSSARTSSRTRGGSSDFSESNRNTRRRRSLATNDILASEPDSPRRSSRHPPVASYADRNSDADTGLFDEGSADDSKEASRQASRRSSRRTSPISPRTSRSTRQRVPSPKSDGSDSDAPAPSRSNADTRVSLSRRSSYASNGSGKSSSEPDMSEEESEAHEMDASETDDEVIAPARKRQRSSPSRRSARRQSYEDPSSSEFGSEIEDEDDDESNDSNAKRPARGRNGRAKKTRSATKKAKTKKPPKKKAKTARKQAPSSPAVKPWPEISNRKIVAVGEEILVRLSNVDEENLFAMPVAEALPEMADEYKKLIDEPMDFRTIEERLPDFRSIRELQDDLVKVFKNCIQFNGRDHIYGQFAQ